VEYIIHIDLCILVCVDEVTGGCRKLHNEDLRDLYSSSSVIRMGEKRNAYRFGSKAKGKETTRKTNK
jgi:hypothetical protein